MKNVFFSANENFALLIASAQAVVIKIKPNEVHFVCKINLPKMFHDTRHDSKGWIGAVDNHGKHVALYHPDNFRFTPREHTIGRTDATAMLIKDKMVTVNTVWLYDLINRDNTHDKEPLRGQCIDIGQACPDEVIEIGFDSQHQQTKGHWKIIAPPKPEKYRVQE